MPKLPAALESFAGDAPWWSEVESCLRANADLASRSNAPPSEPSSSADDRSFSEAKSCDESFAADFVVDFLEPCDQPDALGRLGDFEILEVIGRGGMGVVLKGFQRELGRYVAVKVLAPHLAASGAARQRFVREARAAAAVVHPHVMPIHACLHVGPAAVPGDAAGRLRVAAAAHRRRGRWRSRRSCGSACRPPPAWPPRTPRAWCTATSSRRTSCWRKASSACCSPTSAWPARPTTPRLTRTGVIAGTPQYMSPEQARGEAIDARSDLFSLGSVLYAMATGRPPFRAETTLGVLRRISDTQPRPIREINPDIPEWLERIVGGLHDKSPELPSRRG